MCFLCEGDLGASAWPGIGRLNPLGGIRNASDWPSTFPGNVNARFECCSLLVVCSGGARLPCLRSRASASIAFVNAAGLATAVELAVVVRTELPRLARLVTLAGLVSAFSSKCIGLGIEIAFAAEDSPSLKVVVATGASCGLLIPAPTPAMSDDRALCPGFSLMAGWCLLWASSALLRLSARAAAPVSGKGANSGENVPL